MAIASSKNGNWNDGITSELRDFFDSVVRVTESARETAQKVIDSEIETFSIAVDKRAPVDTGKLKSAYTQTKINSGNFYGAWVGFDGYYTSGQSIEKIANVINYGTKDGRILATKFISDAVHKLKGMNDRINARIEAELESKT